MFLSKILVLVQPRKTGPNMAWDVKNQIKQTNTYGWTSELSRYLNLYAGVTTLS